MKYKKENVKLLELATEKEQERIYYFLKAYISESRNKG